MTLAEPIWEMYIGDTLMASGWKTRATLAKFAKKICGGAKYELKAWTPQRDDK